MWGQKSNHHVTIKGQKVQKWVIIWVWDAMGKKVVVPGPLEGVPKSQAWWHTSVISTLESGQEEKKFKVILCYVHSGFKAGLS